jgi:hypothetical protein
MVLKAVPRYYVDKKFFYNAHIELCYFKKIEVENKDELMKYFNLE